jgi:enterobacterial common antigen flippase
MQTNSTEQSLSPPEAAESAGSDAAKGSYGQILKSTALVGGVSVVNLLVGLVRSKAVALMLGPTGVGLNGIYGTITSLTEIIVGMGISGSGVRQIAEAVGTGDHVRVAKTAAVLRRTSLVLGLVGAAVLIAFSSPISKLTFGDSSQTLMICILAASVFFRLVSAGQGALLQGLRRIPDMARSAILSTVAGTAVMLPLVYFLGQQGIAVSVAASSALGLAGSWWYTRKLAVDVPVVSISEVRTEAAALLHLGSALMVSAMVTVGCSYAIRTAIYRELGSDATGLYQAAWTLGCMYVGFILQAMGADFYPRLTGVAHDNAQCNRLVNEQGHVSLLLAGAGVIGTLTFAPVVLQVFYAASFQPAVEVLRWICLGTALQVVSWPMNFIIMAKGEKALLIWSELAWAVVHLGLAFVSLRAFGVKGAGIAYFGSYVFHVGWTYAVANRLSGFHWTGANRNSTLAYLAGIGTVFVGIEILPLYGGMALGTAAMIASGLYSVRVLAQLAVLAELPSVVRKLLGYLGVQGAAA